VNSHGILPEGSNDHQGCTPLAGATPATHGTAPRGPNLLVDLAVLLGAVIFMGMRCWFYWIY